MPLIDAGGLPPSSRQQLSALPLFQTQGTDTVAGVVEALQLADLAGVQSEAQLHERIADQLRARGIGHKHEAMLTGCGSERIDFLCDGGVGLELKWQPFDRRRVWDQLRRYAASVNVRRLILAGRHVTPPTNPLTIHHKPLIVVRLSPTTPTQQGGPPDARV